MELASLITQGVAGMRAAGKNPSDWRKAAFVQTASLACDVTGRARSRDKIHRRTDVRVENFPLRRLRVIPD